MPTVRLRTPPSTRGRPEALRAVEGLVQPRLPGAARDEPRDGVGSRVRRPARPRDEARDGARASSRAARRRWSPPSSAASTPATTECAAHTAAGKLQGMEGDALWYEAAHGGRHHERAQRRGRRRSAGVAGRPLDEAAAATRCARSSPRSAPSTAAPTCRRRSASLAHDPAYLADVWGAVRHAFDDNRLARRLKEALAFAVSLTSRSRFGTGFHLAEMRRLGVGRRAA